MKVVRTSVLVAAPVELVFDLARDVGIHTRGLAHTRTRVVPPGRTEGLLEAGDLVSMRARHYRMGWRLDARLVVCEPPHRLVDIQERGPWRSMRHEQRLVQTGAGTLLTEELCWRSPAGPLGGVVDALLLRRHLRRLLLIREAHLCMVAEQHAAERAGTDGRAEPAGGTAGDGPGRPNRPTVVGVVLVDGTGRVLAAERSEGGWEFPGGKVEPGESEPDTAVRECAEELGVAVAVESALDGAEPIGDSGYQLRLWTGRIVSGEPAALVHARLRWVPVAELAELDWLPADRPFLARIAHHLADRPGRR